MDKKYGKEISLYKKTHCSIKKNCGKARENLLIYANKIHEKKIDLTELFQEFLIGNICWSGK